MTLSTLLKRRETSKSALQATTSFPYPVAFILDSVPGANEYESMLTTFTISISSSVLKAAARLPLSFVYAGYYLVNNAVLNNPPLFPQLHKYLESSDLLPGVNEDTPRLYIFSDTDKMVPAVTVERHISRISRWMNPLTERYCGSQHASHMKADPKRYWRAVATTWEKACQQVHEEGIPDRRAIKAKL